MRTSFLALAILLLAASAFAEIRTYTHTVKQPFGGSQSPDDARIAAIARAKREVLERAGTYLETLTVVKQGQLDKDNILALAAGVLKTKIVSEKNYLMGEAFGIEVSAQVEVDTGLLEERVKKVLQDKTLLEKYQKSQAREKELLTKIESLEERNQKLQALASKAPEQEKQELKEQFQKVSQGLTAVEWFQKAVGLWQSGEAVDYKQVLEYLNQAIRLDPNLAVAYINRGVAHGVLGRREQAIEDYSQAIRLDPNLAPAYHNRGLAHDNAGRHEQAIEDFNQALRLAPNYAQAYNVRGIAYAKASGDYERAILDFNQAIRLDPNFAQAYNNRGNANHYLGRQEQAIKDYNQAVRLNPDYASAYHNRGLTYAKGLGQRRRALEDFEQSIRLDPNIAGVHDDQGQALYYLGKYQQAIQAYDQALRLDPDSAKTYYNRGNAYAKGFADYARAILDFEQAIRLDSKYAPAYANLGVARILSGQKKRGCEDVEKACDMGSCDSLKWALKAGYCQ
ncbi:MAG: tetratricopeptide repeat protein [Thermodesulfobacteriota bacterium]|nr:tetratricopeptide repeat protein [Thermodesulfobacteriota bacterium]